MTGKIIFLKVIDILAVIGKINDDGFLVTESIIDFL